MRALPTECAECRGPLRPIHVISGGSHKELLYSAGEAVRHLWSSDFKEDGRIVALMCGTCGRVKLYAEPESAV